MYRYKFTDWAQVISKVVRKFPLVNIYVTSLGLSFWICNIVIIFRSNQIFYP